MSARVDHITGRVPRGAALTPSATVWVLLAVAVVTLWPTLSGLERMWRTMFDYQHGYAIAAISALWLFQARRRIDSCEVRPMRVALPALAAAIAAWMIAFRANSELMQQLLVPVVLQLAVLAALGPAVFRRAAAPLAYLYFAIPIWEHFVPLLQWLTTHVAEALLGVIDVPTVVEGNNVTIPAGRFSIIEGCSGKRYLVIGLAFAAIAAVMQGVRGRRLLAFTAATVGMALVTNWIRVVIVIYAGHVSDMQHYLVATEHRSLGYLLFVPLLFAISIVARRLGEERKAEPESAGPCSPARNSRAGWIAPVALLAVPVLVSATSPTAHYSNPALLGRLPVMTGAWQGPLPARGDWQPEFTGAAEERRAAYQSGAARVEVYVNSYGAQSPGRELVFHKNSVAPSAHWSVIRPLPRAGATPALVIAAHSTGARWVIASTYAVSGQLTSAPALAQLYYGIHAVWRPVPAGIVALAAPCLPDCEAATREVRGFWSDNGGALVDLIPQGL